ncbi:MAG: hypothetical protein LUF04_13690 [Bacteroides sp.]|nr:hypothetical protein [Bacteroides sp.]
MKKNLLLLSLLLLWAGCSTTRKSRIKEEQNYESYLQSSLTEQSASETIQTKVRKGSLAREELTIIKIEFRHPEAFQLSSGETVYGRVEQYIWKKETDSCYSEQKDTQQDVYLHQKSDTIQELRRERQASYLKHSFSFLQIVYRWSGLLLITAMLLYIYRKMRL